MDLLMQIALGMIPAFVVLLVVTLITRRHLVPKLVAMALLLCVGVGAAVGHFAVGQQDTKSSTVDSSDSMELVYALIAAGDSQQASELLVLMRLRL